MDFSPKAIALARQKAHQAGVIVDFRLGDATRLDFLQDPFDIALDVGCFHGLNKAERNRYAENLTRLTHPGSLFLLWAMQEQGHFGIGVSAEEVAECFGPQFLLDRVEDSADHGHASAWYWIRRR